jgi:hypothetical protein
MFYKHNFISPGRVEQTEFSEHKSIFAKTSNEISSLDNEHYEVIAHGAGSWRFYPMGISEKGIVYGNGFSNKKTKAKPVNQIIDSTLLIDPNISIELDVHYPTKNSEFNENKGYIIHDQPLWDNDCMRSDHVSEYLNTNTLESVLRHFTERNYYKKSKVYIEIKVKKECDCEAAADSCKTQYVKLAKELNQFAKKYRRTDGDNWLCITSFSSFALKGFRNQLRSETRTLFDYVLIAGYTGGKLKGRLAQSKGYVPKYDSTIKSFAAETAWLDCIWFSVRGITDFKAEFNDLIERRQKLHPDSPLAFSYATYEKKRKKMIKSLRKGSVLKGRIRSFMIDIDDGD